MVDIHIISDSETLAEKCAQLRAHDYLAIDTEFLRTSTYWPQLCLIQIGYGGEGVLVDPLAPDMDLAPFFALMRDSQIVKVFHSGRQDIEIFYYLNRCCPAPLFDTQVAAMACGFGDSISYEQLVRQLLSQKIDKSSRVTDWSKRPLTDRQQSYALSDVTHLCSLYTLLSERLTKNERYDWVAPEFEAMCQTRFYDHPPEEAWRTLKLRTSDNKYYGQLCALATWREREAQHRNKPRGWIMRDDLMREIAIASANQMPLEEIRILPKSLLRSESGQRLSEALAQSGSLKSANIDERENVRHVKNDAKVSMLKLLLKIQCDRYEVASRLLATTAQIEAFANNSENPSPLCEGWRHEIFGKLAHALLNGEISLTFYQGKTQIVKTTPHALKPM